MDNDRFINKLITETNKANVKWKKLKDSFEDYPTFILEGKNNTIVCIKQYDVNHYEDDGNVYSSLRNHLEIYDKDKNILGYIYDTDIYEPSDLRALYRAAERNCNNVNEKMSGFFDNNK